MRVSGYERCLQDDSGESDVDLTKAWEDLGSVDAGAHPVITDSALDTASSVQVLKAIFATGQLSAHSIVVVVFRLRPSMMLG